MDKDLEKAKKWMIIGAIGMALMAVSSFVRGFLHDSILFMIFGVVAVVIFIKLLISIRKFNHLDELDDEDLTDDE